MPIFTTGVQTSDLDIDGVLQNTTLVLVHHLTLSSDMRLSAGICLILTLLASILQAQRVQYGRVKGTVIDSSENSPLEAATVSIFLSSDSSLVSYALTGKRGEFLVKDVPRATKCWLMISFNGYNTAIKNFSIAADQQELDIRTIKINKNYNELGEVTVVAQKPPVVIKQDTIEFNVGAFVTRPNGMIEDVLKQMPGVEIESDGSITINGKKVSKVTLDGKEFFGGDPKIAIKNLPKDIIEKIQVTDNRTRQSRFNKTKPGNEDLAINLTLRKDKSKGWFGMAGAGYGSDKRYEGFANLNHFNGSRQLNFIVNSNNTNRGSYSGEDFNIGNGSGTLGGGGQGITSSKAAGFNFSENLSPKLKLNGSYFYNRGDVENFNRLRRQNILPDTTFFYNAVTETVNTYDNHRVSVNMGYNPDSLTEIFMTLSLDGNKSGMISSIEADSKGGNGSLINNSENIFGTNMKGLRTSAEFFAGRRLNNKGRSISFGTSFGFNNESTRDENKGENRFFKNDTLDTFENIDQLGNTSGEGKFIGMSFTYTEPVLENLALIFQHNYQKSINESNKITNRYNPVTDAYDIRDSLFTNDFQNIQESHNPAINLNFRRDKFHWSLSGGLQILSQDNLTNEDGGSLKQDFINFTPSASLGYNFSKTFNVEMYYNGRGQQPSIQQLQPVPDNRNPLYIVLGNPELQPSFYHNVQINVRQTSGTSFWNGSLSVNSTMRQIIEETFFDEFGRQVSQPVNVNGNYNLSWNLQYSKSWKRKTASFRVNLANRGSYSRSTTYTNKVENLAETYSIGPIVGMNFTIRPMFSINANFNLRYNIARYTLSTVQDVQFNTKRLNVSMFWNYPKRLIIENNLQYNYNSRTAPGFRKGVTMWSAAVNWQLLSKQQATVRLAVYDILKQNAGITRQITQTYIEDNQMQVLQQYFLLSFIYNLRRFGE